MSNEPPTHEESLAYIEAKQFVCIGLPPEYTDAGYTVPERRGGLLMWLLVFATFAFLSGAVFNATRVQGQSPDVNRCIASLVEDVNPALMSRTTARRKARAICYDIRYNDRDFYRALTQ